MGIDRSYGVIQINYFQKVVVDLLIFGIICMEMLLVSKNLSYFDKWVNKNVSFSINKSLSDLLQFYLHFAEHWTKDKK